jgi:hypothetical protein
VRITAVAALCAAMVAAYSGRYLGYDAAWARLWGHQIAQLSLPTYRAAFAPTPHPLVNLVAAVFSAFGGSVGDALLALTLLAFAYVCIAVGAIGARLFGVPAGITAAAVLATRPSLVREAQYGSSDLWFLALLAAALLVEVRTPGRRLRVLSWLGAAGLIRPEAWILSGAYVLYGCWGLRAREWVAPLMLALSAPTVWALSDLVITGDLLHSVHGTRALAAQLDRPRSEIVALVALPQYLRFLVGDLPSAVGLAGVLAGVSLLYRSSLLFLGLGALGMLTFLALGAFGLPLLDRYLLVPAIVLALFCGVAVAGWRHYSGPEQVRRGWIVVGAALAAGLLASGPATLREIRNSDQFTAGRARVQNDLERVLSDPRVRKAVRACPLVVLPDYRALPLVVEALSIPSRDVRIGALTLGESGVQLAYASLDALNHFGVGSGLATVARRPALGVTRVTASAYWLADVRCKVVQG